MNVTTQVALAAEYKIRDWYHSLAKYGTKFGDAKCQVEYLVVGQLRFLKSKPTRNVFVSQTPIPCPYFRKREKPLVLGSEGAEQIVKIKVNSPRETVKSTKLKDKAFRRLYGDW